MARDLGINEGTLGNWIARDKGERSEAEGLSRDEREGLAQLRREVAELRMVMSSSAASPSGGRTRWAGSHGRVHRRPEGRAWHPPPQAVACRGPRGQRVVILEVARPSADPGPAKARRNR